MHIVFLLSKTCVIKAKAFLFLPFLPWYVSVKFTNRVSGQLEVFKSLSMNLQRGNALCVMGTVAHHRKLEEIYNLGTTIQTQEQEG